MPTTRRSMFAATAALGVVALVTPTRTKAREMKFDPVPSVPANPSPGKPGDFDFLAGEWRINHLQRRPGAAAWDEFHGEATCWTILGGVGSVEELRIPARNFNGMGLRLLDVDKKVWSDFWVNARSGVLLAPGQTGSFENGVGIFVSDDVDNDGKPIKAGGLWDQITPGSCRWRQVISRDGGVSWEHTWIMNWLRA